VPTPALYRAGSGEQLLLLHGFTGAWHHWRPVLGELVARYEVVAPTIAGHDGGPPYPIDGPLTLAGATDWLEGYLDELGVDTPHVAGNSMGGTLALELAKRGRARTVVAIAPGGGWTQGDGESRRVGRLFRRQIYSARAAGPRVATVMRLSALRHVAMRDFMRHGGRVPPADAVDLATAFERCAIADRVLAALRADTGVTLEDLDRITCPVPPARNAPRLRREIPGVESVVLPGCGHVPMWDDTRLVVRTISGFVDRHALAGAGEVPSTVA